MQITPDGLWIRYIVLKSNIVYFILIYADGQMNNLYMDIEFKIRMNQY